MLTRLSGANIFFLQTLVAAGSFMDFTQMFQNLFPVLSTVIKHLPKVLTILTPCTRNIQEI